MWKIIVGLLIVSSGAMADYKYIQGIDNGSYMVYKNDKQSIRQFKTTKAGYVNIVGSPISCAESMMLLDGQNRVIAEKSYYGAAKLNVGIQPGQYYIHIIPNADCTINVVLPN